MTIRRLTAEEFSRCPQAEGCTPENMSIIGAFTDDGTIVGRTVLLELAHMEGPWIELPYRNSLVGAKLAEATEREAKESGRSGLFCFIEEGNKTIEDYATRFGYARVPLTLWFKEL